MRLLPALFLSLKPSMDLYPAREPFLLMPGEYLSFRRRFYPADLGWKPGQEHELKLSLKARWKKAVDKELNEANLKALAKIRPLKAASAKP